MKIYLFIFLLTPIFTFGQLEIKLPKSFKIFVNDSITNYDKSWLDSLQHEADYNILLYRIARCKAAKNKIITKIQLPTTLKINQVIRQVILYYSLLDTEAEKIAEKILIYPLFQDTDNSANIECHYSDNLYNFQINNWITTQALKEPTPEEKNLYNRFVQAAIQKTLDFEFGQKLQFEEFAKTSSISAKKIEQVYQKVFLWQNSNLKKQ